MIGLPLMSSLRPRALIAAMSSPLSRLSCIALSLALLTPSARPQVQLPTLGDSISDQVGLQDERKYGDWIMSQAYFDPSVLDDPLLQSYIESLWQPLLRASRAKGNLGDELWERFAWQTLLVRERAINASAWPGGYFVFNLGLIAMTAERDELASVMAHELAHVTQRHIARGVAGEGKNTAITILGTLLGILAMSKTGSPDVGIGVMSAAQTAAQQQALRFSRDMEREADSVGHTVLGAAGYAPIGMVHMFERLDHSMRLMDSGAFPYLRSHPLTSERIGEARQRVSLDAGGPTSDAKVLHALMSARARVLMDDRAEALGQVEGLDAGGRDPAALPQLAARYSAALAAFKLRHRARAEAALKDAQRFLPDLPAAERPVAIRLLAMLGAEGAALMGDGAAAWAWLAPYATDKDPALMLLRAEVAAAPGSTREQRELCLDGLQTHLALQPQDAPAWGRAARLWELQGQNLRAVRALAEVHAARGDLRGAVDRLRAGLRQSRVPGADPVESAVIDARLRTLVYQRRQQLLDMYPRGAPPEER